MAGPREHSGKAIFLALAIAASYWVARQAVYRALPVVETRPATVEEALAINARIQTDHPLFRIYGWDVDYREFGGALRMPDGRWSETLVLTGLSRFREALWLRRDRVVALLRSAGFLACLAAMWRLGGLGAWAFDRRVTATGTVAAVLASAAIWLPFVGMGGRPVYGSVSWPTMFALNVPVGLFEEACFRGLLFQGLASTISTRKAALASSAAFTLWHWGAQDLSWSFPILLYGLSACASLETGLGLPWLALSHAAADTIDLKLTMTDSPAAPWDRTAFWLEVAVASWALWRLGRGPSAAANASPKSPVDALADC